jgi:general stress protein 26
MGAEAREKLVSLIRDIHIAMLTTVDSDGSRDILRSRPMGTIEAEFDGDIWFFTSDQSGKVDDIAREHSVNVAYSSGEAWVSVSGTASLVHDRAKMEALWNPVLKAWFPDGLDTPDIALLRVRVHEAEYWESHGKVAQAVGLLKALVTGQESDAGENAKLMLN